LKPQFGTTLLLAIIRIITFANLTFMAFGVFVETVVGNVTAVVVTTGLTFDVADLAAVFTTGRLLTFDVADFAAVVITTSTILRAVGRGVAVFAADTAGLIQERWADDFTIGSGLVFHVVACVFRSGTTSIVADFAVGSCGGVIGLGGSGGLGGGGGTVVVSSGG
jgi:hypothetical protein